MGLQQIWCRPGRSRRFASLAAALILGATLAGGPLPARELTVALEPEAAIWHDPITVTVSGEGCHPTLSEPSLAPQSGSAWQLNLFDQCAPGQTPAPFTLHEQVEAVAPGPVSVRIRETDGTSTSARATAYELGTAGVQMPAVAFAGELVLAAVTLQAHCVLVSADPVDGSVVTIGLHDECAFPGPPASLAVHQFHVPIGPLPEGRYEIRFLDDTSGSLGPGLIRRSLHMVRPDSCLPDDARLCLRGSRFQVDGTWRDFSLRTGPIHAAPLDDNEESGLLWFFAPDNVELTLKVLDGCAVNDRFWVFIASGSTVEYSLTVTDTWTGQSRTYGNALGHTPDLIADVDALRGCQ